MNTKLNELIEQVNKLIADMDLPINRKDVSRPETTRWLCRNLAFKNLGHKNYADARSKLAELGREQHVLSNREVRQLEQETQK